MSQDIVIRNTVATDLGLVKQLMDKYAGGEPLIIRNQEYYPSRLPGLFAYQEKVLQGFLFYQLELEQCEIVILEVWQKFMGIGTQLLTRLKAQAKEQGCKKLVLMTTNDHTDALRFYQRRGFTISGISLNSVAEARKLKPTIAELGEYGIPIRDEIDLELLL